MAYLVIALLVLFTVREAFTIRERNKLLNRLMAKDYAQYRYYEDKWKGDLKEVERIRDESRAEAKPEPESGKADTVDLSKFDEDWEEEDK
jgi:hypothetical protein